MTRLALWSIALALGLALWVAIIVLDGWWFAGALAYVFLLALTAVWAIGGITAAVAWWEKRRTQ